MPQMTIVQYAEYRGVSDSSVYRAITEGRITLESDENGRRYIDSDKADKEWFENTDSTYTRGESAKQALDEAAESFLETEDDTEFEDEEVEDEEVTDPSEKKRLKEKKTGIRKDINAAKAMRESYNAELARLNYEEKAGKLINAEAVRNEAFKAGRMVRDALLSLPDRVAGEFAAETNQFRIHQRLTEEIKKALVSLKVEDNGPV